MININGNNKSRKILNINISAVTITRQRAQGHRTYKVGIAKPEVGLLLSLQALAVLVSDN